MELGPTKIMKQKIYEKICFLRCGVLDEVVEQKGALPPSKSSIGCTKSVQKKICVYCYYFILLNFKLQYDQPFPFWASSMHSVACS